MRAETQDSILGTIVLSSTVYLYCSTCTGRISKRYKALKGISNRKMTRTTHMIPLQKQDISNTTQYCTHAAVLRSFVLVSIQMF